jgi:predicted acetyltransferase
MYVAEKEYSTAAVINAVSYAGLLSLINVGINAMINNIEPRPIIKSCQGIINRLSCL